MTLTVKPDIVQLLSLPNRTFRKLMQGTLILRQHQVIVSDALRVEVLHPLEQVVQLCCNEHLVLLPLCGRVSCFIEKLLDQLDAKDNCMSKLLVHDVNRLHLVRSVCLVRFDFRKSFDLRLFCLLCQDLDDITILKVTRYHDSLLFHVRNLALFRRRGDSPKVRFIIPCTTGGHDDCGLGLRLNE